ncbi:DUF2380 domain-containing protein [Hyalangium gracile]|uniref:DUF2380 domain-containing protein n=1 Tax=Hyalangium gracile TaxID=394092 RepID=UPI001CCAFECD|nr:DUF2380 domain-containing protein [Hyalangium gracile]
MRHWWWLCLLPALCWGEPLKLAVPSLSVVDVEAQRASFLAEHLAQELSDQGAQVVSAQDLTVMLGLDRQRQLMGCTGGKCVTELTSALGVDCLVTGNVARVSGERFQLNLRMLDATTGQRVRTYTKRVAGFEALLDEMSRAARVLVTAGNKKFGRTSSPQAPAPGPRVTPPGPGPAPAPVVEAPPPEPVPEPPAPGPVLAPAPTVVSTREPRKENSIRRWAWIPVAAGGVALGTGVFFFLGSDAKYKELTDGTTRSTREAAQIRDSGKSQQTVARIGLSVGTTLLITGGAMHLFSGSDSVEPQVSVGQDHVSVGFAGELPW